MSTAVRTSLSALLKDAAVLEKALGGEEQALGATLEEARRIIADATAAQQTRDQDETLDEDDLETVEDFDHLAGLDTPEASPAAAAAAVTGVRSPNVDNKTSTTDDHPAPPSSPPGKSSPSPSLKKKTSSLKAIMPTKFTNSHHIYYTTTKAPVFAAETSREMFDRYDVDGSGFLDFEEVSVALADMGALDGVLASAAAELFQEFDADASGTVDYEEFQELSAKVKELKGSVGNKPIPEVPAGFEESASALPLRRSFEAFAAFGKGSKAGSGAGVGGHVASESLAGRDWAKLVKDCGLIGGAVNGAATDIIFARCAPKGKRALRWDDGTFLMALANVAAEHRVTFGQVSARVAQCAPQRNVEAGNEQASRAAADERAAAAGARAASESANGPPSPAAATSHASLLAMFASYVSAAGESGGAPGGGALAAVDALHALADIGLLRGVSLEDAQTVVTNAIAETPNTAGGKITFEPFVAAAANLRTTRAAAAGSSYKPPEAVQLPLDQRRALQGSFVAFGGGGRGMDGAAWETTVRACGLIGAKVSEATAAIIFAKCKDGAGGGVMAPKVIGFQSFVQAAAHVALEYSVKFEVVAQRVVKCTPAAPPAEGGGGGGGGEAAAGGGGAQDVVAAAAPAVQLADPVEIPAEYRSHAGFAAAFAVFTTQGERLDAAGWGRVVRACGLVGGALNDATAQEIFVQSGAPRNAGGGYMGWEEFLWACAVVGGTHGVMFKIVAARIMSVAQRQEAAQKAAAAEAGGGGGGGDGPQLVQRAVSPPKKAQPKKKKKSSSMFSMFK